MIADSVASGAQPLAAPTDWKPLDLLRLGWMIAEVRGRYRLGNDERLQVDQHIDRHQHALPLAPERSVAEQRIEAEAVLASLATRLSLDRSALSLGVDLKQLDNDADTAVATVKRLAVLLAGQRKRNTDSVAGTWDRLAELFYLWDKWIQDRLAAATYGLASAYQLGRGLAEVYWALDPNATTGLAESWEYLLGDHRFNILATLLRRVSPHLPALTAETITSTLDQWRSVVHRGDCRIKSDAVSALGLQATVWKDLLLSDTSPQTLVATDETLKRARSLRPLLRSFAVESLGALIGLTLIGGAILWAVLVGPGFAKALGATIAGLLGAFGLSSSVAVARVKAVGQGLLEQLRNKISTDAIIAAATYLPGDSRRGAVLLRGNGVPRERHIGPRIQYVD